jgi:hypothetical protein
MPELTQFDLELYLQNRVLELKVEKLQLSEYVATGGDACSAVPTYSTEQSPS